MTTPNVKRPWFFTWLNEAQQALRDGRIRANTFAVLVVLSQFADYTTGKEARPGLVRLHKETGLSERTISDSLKAGETAGLIRLVRRGFGNAGAGSANVYAMSRPGNSPQPATASALASARNSTLSRTHRGSTEETKNQQGTSKNRTVRPKNPPIDWKRVGLTQEQADRRGLTEMDFRNWLFIQQENEVGRQGSK